MHRFFQKISPPFLRKLDHSLLLNRPGLWATRIHYLLFFMAIALGIVILMVYATPMPFYELPGPSAMGLFFSLSGLGFVLWVVQLVHFQAWKQGESHWWRNAFRDQWVYALGVLLIMSLPAAYYGMFQLRKANLQSEETLLADLNALHQGHAYLVHTGIGEYFSEINNQLAYAYYDFQKLPGLLSAVECADIGRRSTEAERLRHLEQFITVAQKYSREAEGLNARNLLASYTQKMPLEESELSELNYVQYDIQENLMNFQEALYRTFDWDLTWEVFLPIGLSTLLLILLLVRTSWKQFFFSMSTALGLLIVEGIVFGLIIGISRPSDVEDWVLMVFFANWVILGFYGFKGKVRNARNQKWRTIAISIFTLLTAIIPWLAVMVWDTPPFHILIETFNWGLLVTLLLWNLFIQGQLLRLGTHPQSR